MAGNIVNWTCCRDMGVNMEVLFNLTNYVKLNIAPHLGQGCAHLAEGWGCRPWVPAAGAQVGPSGGGSAAGCTWLSWSFSGSSRNVLGWWAWLLLIFGGCMLVAQELCHCRSHWKTGWASGCWRWRRGWVGALQSIQFYSAAFVSEPLVHLMGFVMVGLSQGCVFAPGTCQGSVKGENMEAACRKVNQA